MLNQLLPQGVSLSVRSSSVADLERVTLAPPHPSLEPGAGKKNW